VECRIDAELFGGLLRVRRLDVAKQRGRPSGCAWRWTPRCGACWAGLGTFFVEYPHLFKFALNLRSFRSCEGWIWGCPDACTLMLSSSQRV
jgi:hypothetical protein